jgi:hypothetical protein
MVVPWANCQALRKHEKHASLGDRAYKQPGRRVVIARAGLVIGAPETACRARIVVHEKGMAMRRNLLLIGVIAALGGGIAQGKECKGVSYPDQAQIEGSTLTLNGLGLRQATAFKVNVYVAALYVAKTSSDPNAILASNAPYELTLQFVRNVDAADISKGWDEGFAKNAKDQLPALKERIATFNSWMSDVKTGQRMTFTFKPGTGVSVIVNGAAKGTIKGDDFGKALLSIWLGADPPNPEIKAGLLGGACG